MANKPPVQPLRRGGCKPDPPWWAERLEGILDPITLDPLSELGVQPFELAAAPPRSTTSDWFDAETLAMYLVARGNFSHPISRRELDENDCSRLDAHLRHYIPKCKAQVGTRPPLTGTAATALVSNANTPSLTQTRPFERSRYGPGRRKRRCPPGLTRGTGLTRGS